MDRETITTVNGLIMLDMAAAEAYELAASACATAEISRALRGFKADHERHVSELSAWVESHEGKPPEEYGEQGTIIRGYTALSSQEDRSATLAMRGNEELTNTAYASALRADLQPDLREILERGFEDERRHIGWLREEIANRGWDLEPPEIRELVEQAKAA